MQSSTDPTCLSCPWAWRQGGKGTAAGMCPPAPLDDAESPLCSRPTQPCAGAVSCLQDFESISRIGDSKKREQAGKTGRFGWVLAARTRVAHMRCHAAQCNNTVSRHVLQHGLHVWLYQQQPVC